MNPFVWLMWLRAGWRAAKAYDEGTPEQKAIVHKKFTAPIDAFKDGYNGVGPKTQPIIRKPFKIVLLILAIIVFVAMVIGGH